MRVKEKTYLESMTQLNKYEDLLADKTYAIGVQEGEISNTTRIIRDEKNTSITRKDL